MAVQKKIKTTQNHLDVINYFTVLPSYNTCVERAQIKRLKNIDLLILILLSMKN